jgi:hypothetical protein
MAVRRIQTWWKGVARFSVVSVRDESLVITDCLSTASVKDQYDAWMIKWLGVSDGGFRQLQILIRVVK